MARRHFLLFLLLFSSFAATAQNDTTRKGTIRIAKKKDAPVYILADAKFDISGPDNFQPFPVVKGRSFPFNYTLYFYDYFKDAVIDLRGKSSDTVYLQVNVSRKGKVRIKDVTHSMYNGKRSYMDGPEDTEKSLLQLNCFNAIARIKQWYPAYNMDKKVDRFKGQVVIRPVHTNVDATGIITIIFSTEPFDDW